MQPALSNEQKFDFNQQLHTFGPDSNTAFVKLLIHRLQKIPVRHITPINEPSLLGDFSIRSLDKLLDGKDMLQPLHRHDFFYLLAVENGSGEHAIDFNSYEITNYTLFFMRPGQVHQLHLNSESKGFLIQFSAEFYFPQNKASLLLLRKASIQNHYQLDKQSFSKLKHTLSTIQQEFTTKKEGYTIVVKSSMDVLLVELTRNQKEPITNQNLHLQEKFDKFSQLLETHILNHKQVSEYANMMNLSIYQLNSITKLTVGKTCSQVIDEQVILEAKRCILATSNQISQTAYRLGYEDVSYFIRFFKKHTGYTPDSFRQNFR